MKIVETVQQWCPDCDRQRECRLVKPDWIKCSVCHELIPLSAGNAERLKQRRE